MRSLDAAEITAIQAGTVIARDFVWITVKDRSIGSDVDFGWWSDVGNVLAEVEDGLTGLDVFRTFVGGGVLMSIGPIPLTADLTVRTVDIELSPIASTVESALRTNDPRLGSVQIYRGYMDLETRLLVAPAKTRFVGIIDEAPITTPEEGAEGAAKLVCVSRMRELTRSNTAVRSHEDQKLRLGSDGFYQDADVVGEWEIHWGGTAATPNEVSSGKTGGGGNDSGGGGGGGLFGNKFIIPSLPLLGPVVIT